MHNQEYGFDQTANRAKDKVADLGSKANDVVDTAERTGAKFVDGLASKASDVADAAERTGAKFVKGIENAASTVRDRVDDTVSYFRDNDARAMAEDVKSYVKSHPAQALIGALVIGFFAGRMIRRS